MPTPNSTHRARRVRRWDEPQPPNPYPERPARHPGVRQAHTPGPDLAWEFTNGLPITEPLVQQATAQPDRMLTTPTQSRHMNTLGDNTPVPGLGRTLRLGWWAVALSVVAQLTVAAAIHWGNANPLTAGAVSIAVVVCSLLLITAEQATNRGSGR